MIISYQILEDISNTLEKIIDIFYDNQKVSFEIFTDSDGEDESE